MSEALYLIESTLEQLCTQRDIAEFEGDSEALKAIDREIESYLTKEAAKVDSYVALMTRCSDSMDACDKAIERLRDHKKRSEAMLARLKENALRVMQAFGVRVLETPTNKLRVCGNGGKEPLEVDGNLVPYEFTEATIKLPLNTWHTLVRMITDAGGYPMLDLVKESGAPDTDAIRAALKHGQEVPGARLLPRGVHLRCD